MGIDHLYHQYKAKTPNGAAHYEKERAILPGGVSGSGKFIKPYPVYAKSASGCKVEDLDDNVYIDMVMGNGANILGHGSNIIKNAVIDAADNPPFTFLAHEREYLLAKK